MKSSVLWTAVALAVLTLATAAQPSWGQLDLPLPTPQNARPNPLADATAAPGKLLLLSLEARFAKDVIERGGEGFAAWFADDGVALGNGVAPLVGKLAIAKSATWSPKAYRLVMTPTEAQMGPSGDMGYVWGHFEGRSKDARGRDVILTGRYITIWRRQVNGDWKLALDAGANEPAEAEDCCKLPAHR